MTTKLYGSMLTGYAGEDKNDTYLKMDHHIAEGAVLEEILDEILGANHELGAEGFFFASDDLFLQQGDQWVLGTSCNHQRRSGRLSQS